MKYLRNDLKIDHYDALEMEIIDLENEDIITTSDPEDPDPHYPGEPDPID